MRQKVLYVFLKKFRNGKYAFYLHLSKWNNVRVNSKTNIGVWHYIRGNCHMFAYVNYTELEVML